MSRKNKTLELVGRRVRVLSHGGRALVGQLLAFDAHMNLVLADCEEFRRTRRSERKKTDSAAPSAERPAAVRRTLGLVVLRGRHVVALTPDGAGVPVDANNPAATSLSAAEASQYLPSFSSLPPRVD